jgi:hypothetical protein
MKSKTYFKQGKKDGAMDRLYNRINPALIKMGNWAYLIPTVLMCVLSIVTANAQAEISRVALEEKYLDMSSRIDFVAADLESYYHAMKYDPAYDLDYYVGVVINNATWLDDPANLPLTFCAAYDKDYNLLSEREPSYGGVFFDPLTSEQFMTDAGQTPFGTTIIPFEDKAHGVELRDMWTYHRWFFSDSEKPTLMVIAISKYTVATEADDLITLQLWLGASLPTAIILLLLSYIGYQRKQIGRRQEWTQ